MNARNEPAHVTILNTFELPGASTLIATLIPMDVDNNILNVCNNYFHCKQMNWRVFVGKRTSLPLFDNSGLRRRSSKTDNLADLSKISNLKKLKIPLLLHNPFIEKNRGLFKKKGATLGPFYGIGTS